jgi:hypothetical protein
MTPIGSICSPCGRRKVTEVVVLCRWAHEVSQEKSHGVDPELSSSLRVSTGPDGHDRGCVSQFNPTIDKERKLIGNLRWNMPVLI